MMWLASAAGGGREYQSHGALGCINPILLPLGEQVSRAGGSRDHGLGFIIIDHQQELSAQGALPGAEFVLGVCFSLSSSSLLSG